MNITRLISTCMVQSRTSASGLARCLSTSIFSPCTPKPEKSVKSSFLLKTHNLLVPNCLDVQTVRTYKAKVVLTLRCPGCYYERRQGRMYVECSLKPRHKQMKKIAAKNIFRDDYSEGNISEACWWKYRTDRHYRQGNTKFAKYNWLQDRLGKDL